MSLKLPLSVNQIAEAQHAWVESMGWHDDVDPSDTPDTLSQSLADIILKALDVAVSHNIDIEKAIIDKMILNAATCTDKRDYF
jgi:hypothetical protein